MINNAQIKNIILMTSVITFGYIFFVYVLGKTGYISTKMIMIHHDIKCIFKEEGCEKNDITLFTLCMSVLYFLVGYNIPHYYITAFVLSIGFQIVRQYMDAEASYLIDPLANITGYALGSVLNSK
jgi:hypothetical protein